MQKGLWLATLFFVITAVASALEVETLIDESLDLLENGENKKALEKLTLVLQEEPDNGTAIFLRGMAYGRLKKYDQALKDLEKGKALEGEFSLYSLEVGRIQFFKRNYPSAIANLRKYEKKYPGEEEVVRLLGFCYFFTEQYENAIKYFKLALKRSKIEEDAIRYCLAICHLKQKQIQSVRVQINAITATGSDSWFQKRAWKLGQYLKNYKVDESRNPWWVQLQLTGGYDSNPLAFGDDLPSSLAQRYDWFHHYFLRGVHYWALNMNTVVYAQGYIYGKHYIDLDNADELAFGGELGIEHDENKYLTFRAGVRYQQYYIDYQRYSYDFTGFAGITVKENDWTYTELEGSAKNRWFFHSPIDSNDLSGGYFDAKIAQTFSLKARDWNIAWELKLGAQHSHARPIGDNYSYDSDRLFLEFYGPLGWSSDLGFRAEYGWRNYQFANIYSPVNAKRDDKFYAFHAYFSREMFVPSVRFYVSYTFRVNDSNIGIFDYKREVVMFGILVNLDQLITSKK